MRKRKWAIIAFIMLIASIFLSLETWRLLKANEKLKRYILTEFRPILGDQLHISRVHVGFGNLHIRGLRYHLPDNHSSVYIKDLRLGYNIINLLVRGFDLQYISQDVLFEEPTFFIRAVLDTAVVADEQANSTFLSVIPQLHLESALQGLNLFNHITLKGGRIIYSENDSTSITLVHSLQGGVFRDIGDSTFIRLDGAFLNSHHQNVEIIGRGAFGANSLSMLQAKFSHYDLRDGLPFLDKNVIDMQKGYLEGSILIKQNATTHFHELSGEFFLIDCAASLFDQGLYFSELYSAFSLEKGSITIDRALFKFNGSPATASGSVLNIRDPEFDILLAADRTNIAALVQTFSAELAQNIRGQANVRLSIKGPAAKPRLKARFYSPSVEMSGIKLTGMRGIAEFHQKKLYLSRFAAHLYDHDIKLNGGVDFSIPERPLFGDISARGSFQPSVASLHIDSVVVLPSFLQAQISGSLNEPVVLGSLLIAGQAANGDSLLVETAVSLIDKQLTLETTSGGNSFQFSGTIDWRTAPAGLSINAHKIENLLFAFWDVPYQNFWRDNATLSLSAFGTMNKLSIQTNLARLAGDGVASPILTASADFRQDQNNTRTRGVFTLHPESPQALNGNFYLTADKESITLPHLRIGDDLQASFQFLRNDQKQVSGNIRADALNIATIMGVPDSVFTGTANIRISLLGTVSEPRIDGQVNIFHARFRNMGTYESFANFCYDSTGLNLQKWMLNQGEATILYASGSYDDQKDNLDFTIRGAGFDIAGIFAARKMEQPLVSGKAFVDLHISGRSAVPQISGLVAVKEGKISKFPFDEMELKLGAPQPHATSPHFLIDEFRLTRFDEYEIIGEGIFPFSLQDSLRLDINGAGNFLQMLPDINAYFQSPQSECRITGRMRGTRLQPRVEQARLQLRNGSLNFRSVVPHITGVNGDLVLDMEEQFLRLDSLSGLMGGKPFKIYSKAVEEITTLAPLQNIRLGGSDVHMGVLVFETPEKGVPLNFIGLMEPNEFAQLELKGKVPNEKFYFASLGSALTLRGRINIHNGKIMFPFYEGRHAAPRVKEFLENLQWDLFVSPMSNTRFVRTFPGAIDEVYVDLKLDDNYGGLDLVGQLADETFRINGQVRATKGFLEYLDLTFRVDQVGVEFDRGSLMPVTYGRAKTTVTDSLGIPSNIYITMQTVDNTMDKKSVDDIVREEKGRARLNRIRFKLSSDNPNIGVTEAQIMASLGYSSNNLQNSALEAIGFGAENLILRPLFRPVEKTLEQKLGLDYVRFSSQLTKNIILFNLNDNWALNNRLALLQSTKVMFGKYLSDRFFLQYTGQIESGVRYRYKAKDLGIHHTIGLEFQINPQLLMELEYDYDSLMLYNRDDKRIVFRHWFPF